jgi:CheY-like chemotaxis protein
MDKSPPAPPQTIIVLDDHPIDVSFIRSVLDAHALPYEVQVIDHGDRAFDVLDHLAQHEPLRAPTLILLDHNLAQRDSQEIVRRLKTLWPLSTPQRVRMRLTPRPTAARTGTPPRPWWQRGLAWGVSLGLLVGLVWSVPSLWLSRQPPLVPASPQTHSDQAAAALTAPAASVATPAVDARPAAQGQTLAERASVARAAPEGTTPPGLPLQRPKPSVARGAAHRGPKAAAPPRASRTEHLRHAGRRHATLVSAVRRHPVQARDGVGTATRPHEVERDRVVSAYRPGEVSVVLPASQPPGQRVAFDPIPEVERPWTRRIVNEPASE